MARHRHRCPTGPVCAQGQRRCDNSEAELLAIRRWTEVDREAFRKKGTSRFKSGCPTQGGWSAPAARRQARSTGRGRPTAHRRDGGWDTYAQPYSGVVTEGFPVNFGPSPNSKEACPGVTTLAPERITGPVGHLCPCRAMRVDRPRRGGSPPPCLEGTPMPRSLFAESFPVNFGPSPNRNKLATRALETETDPLLPPCQLRFISEWQEGAGHRLGRGD